MKTFEYHKSNLFIVILGISAALIFLAILVLNVFQKQGFSGRAYKSLGCDTNRDCPESTSCQGGVCVLSKPIITQTPLSYVNVKSIIEKPDSIPAVYERPTPAPKVNRLVQISGDINHSIISIFGQLGNILSSLVNKFMISGSQEL